MNSVKSSVRNFFFPISYLWFSALNYSALFQRLPFVLDIGLIDFLRQRSKIQNGFEQPKFRECMVKEQ